MNIGRTLSHEYMTFKLTFQPSSVMSIYRTTDAWRPLIIHLGFHVEGFTFCLFTTLLEAMQEENEDSDMDTVDEFTKSESEYIYQWLEYLISLLIKGQLASGSVILLDDIVFHCILSQNLWYESSRIYI